MPIARFQLPDGRIGRFEVPDGTSPEQAQAMISESLNAQPEAQPTESRTAGTQFPLAIGKEAFPETLRQTLRDTDFGTRNIAGAGTALSNLWEGGKQLVKGSELYNLIANQRIARPGDSAVADPSLSARKIIAEEAPVGSLAGNIALTALPFGVVGSSAKGAGMVGGLTGGMQPVSSEGERIKNIAVGAGLAYGGQWLANNINPVVEFAKKVPGYLPKKFLGMTTGAGDEAISTAYRSGKSGGTAFLDNMRGNVGMADVLDDAKAGLSQMRVERGAQYRAGMAGISKDKTILDLSPIQSAINNIRSMGSYKGQAINKNAAGVVDDIAKQVDDWSKLDPAEYHTPEGLDALKQAIGDIRDATQFGTPGRKAADTAYNAIKKQINDQAPEYAKVMKGYSDASELISEIQRTLVGGEKTSADTALRKLQSLMRNNVNTNYGNRLGLAKELEKQGGRELIPALAGQAMTSATPRGLQGLAASGTALYGLTNPAFLSMLPAQSPRLVGELAYKLGQASGGANNLSRAINSKTGNLLPRATRGILQYAPVGLTVGGLEALNE